MVGLDQYTCTKIWFCASPSPFRFYVFDGALNILDALLLGDETTQDRWAFRKQQARHVAPTFSHSSWIHRCDAGYRNATSHKAAHHKPYYHGDEHDL